VIGNVEIVSLETLFLIAMALAAGVVRGFTGGMGANAILAPLLALAVGPREAVPIVILLNVVSSVQLMPRAVRLTRWNEILPMAIAAVFTVPLGVAVLLAIDQDTMRRVVAATAMLLTVLMFARWRYTGPRGAAVAASVGGMAGFLNGAVSIGGPPVILYLLSGPDKAEINRAQFISFLSIVQPVALIIFAVNGNFSSAMIVRASIMLVPFAAAIWAGAHLFHRSQEETFRRVALGAMLAASLVALFS
jgi:uncharacterized membrane protein YfcA